MRLSPRTYEWLQNVVHKGHQETFRRLEQGLELKPGETVVEVGCGTGVLARHFVARGYDYWGVDLDEERIEQARRQVPGATFVVGDAAALEGAALPRFRRAVIHGLLHHLDDASTRRVLDHLLGVHPEMRLAITEPFRPRGWWANPLGTLLARLDEGAFVRPLREWQLLFGPYVERLSTRGLWPRWPVPFVDVVLSTRHTASAAAV